MKYHHDFIRCVGDERIAVCSWGQLDEHGRLVYEYPDDGTVRVEIYGVDGRGDMLLNLTPPQALMLNIALNEAIYDLHRNDGWPDLKPPIRLITQSSTEDTQEEGESP